MIEENKKSFAESRALPIVLVALFVIVAGGGAALYWFKFRPVPPPAEDAPFAYLDNNSDLVGTDDPDDANRFADQVAAEDVSGKKDGDLVLHYFTAAQSYMQGNSYDKAIEQLKKAEAIEASSPAVLEALAVCYQKTGDTGQSNMYIDKAIAAVKADKNLTKETVKESVERLEGMRQ